MACLHVLLLFQFLCNKVKTLSCSSVFLFHHYFYYIAVLSCHRRLCSGPCDLRRVRCISLMIYHLLRRHDLRTKVLNEETIYLSIRSVVSVVLNTYRNLRACRHSYLIDKDHGFRKCIVLNKNLTGIYSVAYF